MAPAYSPARPRGAVVLAEPRLAPLPYRWARVLQSPMAHLARLGEPLALCGLINAAPGGRPSYRSRPAVVAGWSPGNSRASTICRECYARAEPWP